jgi:hypothetical protein
MKSVRCLLMGSAAGLAVVSAAQAADLPVKAAPVEYVKVCSLYGAGFWYVPGTDTCIKIGTWVRFQVGYNVGDGNVALGSGSQTQAGRFTRSDTSPFGEQMRALVTVDARTQTEYGTLRSYMDVGQRFFSDGRWPNVGATPGATTTGEAPLNSTNNNNNVDASRAFIQFAGFTAGRIRSFYDINAPGAYTLSNNRILSDTADPGIFGIGYTAQFGGGVSVSLALEDPGAVSPNRVRATTDIARAAFGSATLGGGLTLDNGPQNFFDPVLALRIDQSWGYASITGALHNDSGDYYNNATGGAPGLANTIVQGHPGDTWGWATQAGFLLTDFLGLKGDTFALQAAFGRGALGYVTKSNGTWFNYKGGAQIGYGAAVDGIYANGTAIDQSTAWAAWAAYEHYWTPKLHTAIQGGIVGIEYDSTAKSMICAGAPGFGPLANGSLGFALASATGQPAGFTNGWSNNSQCNPNYGFYQVGTRTIWNPHPDLDIGVELMYTGIQTSNKGATVNVSATTSGALPAGQYTFADTGVWSALFRIQRNFLP